MSNYARDRLNEYREDYALTGSDLSEAEAAELLKYIELSQAKESNIHLAVIRKLIACAIGVPLIITAIGCFLWALNCANANQYTGVFVFFVIAAISSGFGAKALSLRK